MLEANRLHRSDDEVIAGVCAGAAECFDLDPIAVRILAVLLAICTGGLAVAVYAVMWLVLPKRMEVPAPIACAAYVPAAEPVPAGFPRKRRGAAPVPPAGFVVDDGCCKPAPAVAPVDSAEEPCDRCGMSGWSRLCVWLGSALLAVDAALLVDHVVEGIVWWQLWPVLCVVAGLVLMVVPSKKGSFARRFSCGLVIVAASVVMLFMSIGILAPSSVFYAMAKLWPIVLIMAGLVVMNVSFRDQMFDFGLALCVIVVCVAMCTAFAIPGTLEQVTLNLPFGPRTYHINPWL